MKDVPNPFTFTVILGAEAHRLAEQFRKHQRQQEKGKQVYLNTLAVYAVKFYLDCLGLETDCQASDSFDPVAQTLMDVADLEVKNLGKLECRSVLPEQEFVYIPAEVWSNRIGYVAVQMTKSLTEVVVVGFTKTATTENLPISELRSLDEFPDFISQIRQPQPVNLSQWLHNIFEAGWQTVEALLLPPQAQLAFNFRGTDGVRRRGKFLELERAGKQVALCVGLKPVDESEVNIVVEVYPTGNQNYLPPDLQVMVLDDEGIAVMEAQARTTKNIQFEFSGELGERFSVKVGLGDVSITEGFVI
ncbi:DUF1822 family protein [Argonema antarcticum]|uniref:DUF1822 family protein n=1 Tax=Argonema antarcticum TaxID=2942763 RepID=UPI0020128F73|nr:DUF1822 family protein [Argonema antarcticum]MCL1474990.1 DUF1822 family protein [Argonema antarcticum A004/B2]